MSLQNINKNIAHYLPPERIRISEYLASSSPEKIDAFYELLKNARSNVSTIISTKNRFKELTQQLKALGACHKGDTKLCNSIIEKLEEEINKTPNKNDYFPYYSTLIQGGEGIADSLITKKSELSSDDTGLNFTNITGKEINDNLLKPLEETIDLLEDNKRENDTLSKVFNSIHNIKQEEKRGGKYNIPKKKYENNTLKDLEDYKYRLKYNEFFYDGDIKTQDIILFVITIFVIRTITLMIIRLMIDINMIKSFEEGLVYYISIYILLLGIIFSLVNIEYKQNDSFVFIKEYLYYLYYSTNGTYRIILHCSILLLILLIPLIIKAEQNEENREDNDLKSKRNIYKELSSFSLILWIFLTIISLIIK